MVKSRSDARAVTTLSLLYVFRMLGLFMVFPVLSAFGMDYRDATPFLLGVALGGYGITQAIFQIPLGLLSDYLGRKPVIILGFILFILGSLIAAMADSVWGLVAGRVLQGTGAVASAVMALLGDLTTEQNRTRAMAIVGMSIGISFTVAMIVGPALAGTWGLASIFWLSALLACVGIAIVVWLVPNPLRSSEYREHRPAHHLLAHVLSNPDLRRLDFGIFALHFALTATFVVVPVSFARLGVQPSHQWWIYLPVMLAAFVLMMPLIYVGERKRKLKRVFLGAIAIMVVAEVWLINAHGVSHWVMGLLLFFVAFNLLEASLPSLVSKQAPAGSKGTAMGVYSTSQFLGAALGGIVGGWLYGRYGAFAALLAAALICACWWLFALTMREPRYLESVSVPCSHPVVETELVSTIPGVVEAKWAEDHQMLYLKVESKVFDRVLLRNFLGQLA